MRSLIALLLVLVPLGATEGGPTIQAPELRQGRASVRVEMRARVDRDRETQRGAAAALAFRMEEGRLWLSPDPAPGPLSALAAPAGFGAGTSDPSRDLWALVTPELIRLLLDPQRWIHQVRAAEGQRWVRRAEAGGEIWTLRVDVEVPAGIRRGSRTAVGALSVTLGPEGALKEVVLEKAWSGKPRHISPLHQGRYRLRVVYPAGAPAAEPGIAFEISRWFDTYEEGERVEVTGSLRPARISGPRP